MAAFIPPRVLTPTSVFVITLGALSLQAPPSRGQGPPMRGAAQEDLIRLGDLLEELLDRAAQAQASSRPAAARDALALHFAIAPSHLVLRRLAEATLAAGQRDEALALLWQLAERDPEGAVGRAARERAIGLAGVPPPTPKARQLQASPLSQRHINAATKQEDVRAALSEELLAFALWPAKDKRLATLAGRARRADEPRVALALFEMYMKVGTGKDQLRKAADQARMVREKLLAEEKNRHLEAQLRAFRTPAPPPPPRPEPLIVGYAGVTVGFRMFQASGTCKKLEEGDLKKPADCWRLTRGASPGLRVDLQWFPLARSRPHLLRGLGVSGTFEFAPAQQVCPGGGSIICPDAQELRVFAGLRWMVRPFTAVLLPTFMASIDYSLRENTLSSPFSGNPDTRYQAVALGGGVGLPLYSHTRFALETGATFHYLVPFAFGELESTATGFGASSFAYGLRAEVIVLQAHLLRFLLLRLLFSYERYSFYPEDASSTNQRSMFIADRVSDQFYGIGLQVGGRY